MKIYVLGFMTTYNYYLIFREVNYCKDKQYFSSLEMICFTRGYLSISLNHKTHKLVFISFLLDKNVKKYISILK